MLDFKVDNETCISCGQCASDCPAMIISMETNLPTIDPELEQYCIQCMHCVAICSEGSVSILGYHPDQGIALSESVLPTAEQVEVLIKARRTTRNFQDRNVDEKLIAKMVNVASHAPSGHNDRGLHYSVIDDKGVLFDLRDLVYQEMDKLIADQKLPEGLEMFVDILDAWKQSGKDIIFRNAPHMLIVSADKESASPLQDAIISLSSFELYANSNKLGTVWNGLATLTLSELLPSLQKKLGIPESHQLEYVMGFGHPAIWYKRTIERPAPSINRVTSIS